MITKVTEPWGDWSLSATETERKTDRIFVVEFDNDDNPLARRVLAQNARCPVTGLTVPAYNSKYPYDEGLILIDKQVSQNEKDGPCICIVRCSYLSLAYKKTGQDPLKEKPQISWTFATTDEPIDRDIKGKAILNSAYESFDPPITQAKHDLVLRYVRNEKRFDPIEALKYLGKTNSNMFLGAPQNTVKCESWEGEKIYNEAYGDYFRVTREFHFRLDEINGKRWGWVRRILDQGCRELIGFLSTGEPDYQNILDHQGDTVTQPVPLDGNGMQLHPKDGEWPPAAVFLEFDTYENISFSPLNIRI